MLCSLVRITQVTLGEVRVTLIGPLPRIQGRFAYTDDAGQTYGQTDMSVFSKETWAALDELKTSMERDLVSILETSGEVPDEEEPPESNAFDEIDGSTFEDEQPE